MNIRTKLASLNSWRIIVLMGSLFMVKRERLKNFYLRKTGVFVGHSFLNNLCIRIGDRKKPAFNGRFFSFLFFQILNRVNVFHISWYG